MTETSSITVTEQNRDEQVTFTATQFGDADYVPLTLEGPTNVCLDQIVVDPADEQTYCGVELNFRRTGEHHTHRAGHVVISAEDEERLTDWMDKQGVEWVEETVEWRTKSLDAAGARGKCAGCHNHFTENPDWWAVTLHRDDTHDLHYCSEECFVSEV